MQTLAWHGAAGPSGIWPSPHLLLLGHGTPVLKLTVLTKEIAGRDIRVVRVHLGIRASPHGCGHIPNRS